MSSTDNIPHKENSSSQRSSDNFSVPTKDNFSIDSASRSLAQQKDAPIETPATKKYKPSNKPMITRDQYIDYDFSTIRDTKGGFLYDPKLDPQAPNSMVKDRAPVFIKDITIDGDGSNAPRCKVCQTLVIDPVFHQVFKLSVCDKCKRDFPDRFSLLTKTEVKEDYLLTEDELRDKDLFLSWSKPNPRKSTWNNMILYVREQVEEYAYKKWGGSEGLDAEFDRRESNKKKKKDVKFKAKLRELRKRTRTEEWQQKRSTKFTNSVHEHQFEDVQPKSNNPQKKIQECSICQMQVEVEEF